MRTSIVHTFLLLCLGLAATGCGTVRVLSPYDQVIDEGLMAYREQVNVLVKDLADHGGQVDGTFEASKPKWNVLQAKIELLVDRAYLQGGERACKLPQSLMQRLLAVAGDDVPPEVKAQSQQSEGSSEGCTVRLLSLIRSQLDLLMQIHRDTDKCPNAEGAPLSCMRPKTAETALRITNQSINAAWVVETAKKRGEEN